MEKFKTLLVVTIILLPLTLPATPQTLPEAVEAYLGTQTCDRYYIENGAAVVVTMIVAGKPAEVKWNSSGKTIRSLMNEYLQGFTKKVEIEVTKVKVYPAPKNGKTQPGYELESANKTVDKDRGGGELTPIGSTKNNPGGEWSFPDSIKQEEIKKDVWLRFTWLSTQISQGSRFTWDIITMIFTGIFIFLVAAMFFSRFIAASVAGEGPVKIYGLGIVSINQRMLRIFGWSSFTTLVIALIIIGFFVITCFLWICDLGWPVWLTAISFWPVQVFGTKIVNWATPDLEDGTSALLLGAGNNAHAKNH